MEFELKRSHSEGHNFYKRKDVLSGNQADYYFSNKLLTWFGGNSIFLNEDKAQGALTVLEFAEIMKQFKIRYKKLFRALKFQRFMLIASVILMFPTIWALLSLSDEEWRYSRYAFTFSGIGVAINFVIVSVSSNFSLKKTLLNKLQVYLIRLSQNELAERKIFLTASERYFIIEFNVENYDTQYYSRLPHPSEYLSGVPESTGYTYYFSTDLVEPISCNSKCCGRVDTFDPAKVSNLVTEEDYSIIKKKIKGTNKGLLWIIKFVKLLSFLTLDCYSLWAFCFALASYKYRESTFLGSPAFYLFPLYFTFVMLLVLSFILTMLTECFQNRVNKFLARVNSGKLYKQQLELSFNVDNDYFAIKSLDSQLKLPLETWQYVINKQAGTNTGGNSPTKVKVTNDRQNEEEKDGNSSILDMSNAEKKKIERKKLINPKGLSINIED